MITENIHVYNFLYYLNCNNSGAIEREVQELSAQGSGEQQESEEVAGVLSVSEEG